MDSTESSAAGDTPPHDPTRPSDHTPADSARATEGISANRRGFFRQILALGVEQAEKATRRFDDALAQFAYADDVPSDPPTHSTPAPPGNDAEADPPSEADPPLKLNPPKHTQPRETPDPRA